VDEWQARAGLGGVEEVATRPLEEEAALRGGCVRRLPVEEAGAEDAGRDLVGVEAQRILDGPVGGGDVAERGEGVGAAGVRLREVGVGGDGGVELRERLPRAARGAEGDAETRPGLAEVGRHLERVLEGHLGPRRGGRSRAGPARRRGGGGRPTRRRRERAGRGGGRGGGSRRGAGSAGRATANPAPFRGVDSTIRPAGGPKGRN
jgi:hypothetical protein